jgi:hypothetical protein
MIYGGVFFGCLLNLAPLDTLGDQCQEQQAVWLYDELLSAVPTIDILVLLVFAVA